MPVKLYFTTGISNWLCVNSDSVDTQQPITRARGVWACMPNQPQSMILNWGWGVGAKGAQEPQRRLEILF